MTKALIVYSTRTGDTTKIAEYIAEGLRFSMVDVTLKDVKDVKNEKDLMGYDACLFGSSTYHGKMMQKMETMLFLAEKAELEGKIGGSFGAFGWSGEAAERIYDTMANIYKMEMVGGPLMLKNATIGGGMKMAQDYGKEVAKKLENS